MPVGIGGEDLAQAVHAVALFAGPIAKGMAAAQQLQEKLRAGSLAPYLDPKRFGKVHLETLSAPYLVSGLLAWGCGCCHPSCNGVQPCSKCSCRGRHGRRQGRPSL
jgi:hypothetical protein